MEFIAVLFCYLFFTTWQISFAVVSIKSQNDIEVYQLNSFPNQKVALHMPCEESNVFATKCMCHLRCTDPKCGNAIALCQKYKRFLDLVVVVIVVSLN